MLRRAYRYFAGDYLLRNSAIVVAAGLLTGALNYVFQVMAARLLSVQDYGVMGAFYALFYTVSFSSQAISLFITRDVVLAKDEAHRASVLRQNALLFGGIGLAALLLYLLLIPATERFMHVGSAPLICVVGLVLFFSFVGAVLTGFARGLEDFMHPSAAGVLGTLFKLVCGVGLILLGVGVAGAFVGILVGTILTLVYLAVRYRASLRSTRARVRLDLRAFAWYFVIFFLSILFIDLDVLLVKYYFPAYDAGLYAALSLLGKIVLFTAGATVPVMFPRAVKHLEKGERKEAMRFFWKAVGLALACGGAVVLAYALAPSLVVRLLYGNKYPIAQYVALAGLEVLLYVVLSIVVMLALAMRRYAVVVPLLAGVALQAGLIARWHASILSVLLASIAALAATLLGSGIVVMRRAKREQRERHGL